MTSPPHRGRLHGLDACRGIAALCVVLFHVLLRYPSFMLGQPLGETPLFPGFTLKDAGVVPVLWFFTISGFVIAWTVDRCLTPMDFVVSRVSRIYPTYWAALAIVVLIQAVEPLPGRDVSTGQVLANLTMLQAYVRVPDVAGVFWSLAVELLFYLYALVLFATGWWPRVHRVAAAWAGAALGASLLKWTGAPVPWMASELLLLQFAPFLAGGMMLYRLWRGQTPVFSAAVLAVCGLTVITSYNPVPALTCFAVAGVIAWSARGGAEWLAAPPLVWLGGISYALYLVHEQLSYVIMRAADANGWPHGIAVALAVAASLSLAWGLTRWVEQPALRAIRTGWRRIRPRSAVAARP